MFTIRNLKNQESFQFNLKILKWSQMVLRLSRNCAEILNFLKAHHFTKFRSNIRKVVLVFVNRPFPSSPVPPFQSESKCETILMKMTLICMKMKSHAELIFIRKVSHLDSF